MTPMTPTFKPCHASVGAPLAAPGARAWQPLDHWASPAFRSARARPVNPLGIHPESFAKGRSFDFRRVSAIRCAPTGYCYGNTFGRRKREKAPALHRIAARLRLECGGLPPLSRAHQRQERKRYARGGTAALRKAIQNHHWLGGVIGADVCLRLDQIAANCESDQIAKAPKLHFAHDVVAMAFHRARGNAEHRGCLLIAFPARQKLYHFHLAV
jgi:hypothetical protein